MKGLGMNEREYPYESGDFTVIGPECFTSTDASVISYKGVNYYPREESGLVFADAVHAVMALHAEGGGVCDQSGMPYPCATVRAVQSALKGAGDE